ncbi:hypothetical protein [Acinetobacter baumannii]|uniref:hypothetical protein n=1 Tax=Acinetobacter baumannii TaxID=470 RepID=UPI00135F7BCC|nr:hypothetical protein [Acinetobacter baumannii]MDA4924194.1 hypothetical protein [Acinetobacter baumannii]MDH2468620.1 hypothetical protein [Acinetobacter baumannii]CAA0287522.1 hypothetical protein AB945B12_03897 [Acinetobacter baumannii]HEO1844810.1 hypothetical protein [Acinetobacter baumannii]
MNNQTSFIKKISNIIFSIRGFIYFITLFFITILGLILFLPFGEENTFSVGNLHIVFKPINLGEFGGFLSGIFAPLAFLWLILNMKQQDKNIEISEKELNILLQEKENRRKITKANFTIAPPKPEIFNVNDKLLNFKVEITSDIPLKDCYIKKFNDKSPFTVISSNVKGQKSFSTFKKSINKDELCYLNIVVNITNFSDELSVLKDNIEIFYLDIDGFEQNQLFEIFFYLPERGTSTDNSPHMYAIILLVPLNN